MPYKTKKTTIKTTNKIKNIISYLDQQRQKKVLFFEIKWLMLSTIYLIHLE